MAQAKSVLMVVTSHNRIDETHATGLWFDEFAQPYRLFREHGLRVTVASPRGGPAPIDPRSEPEDIETADVEDAIDALRNTAPLESVNPAVFDAVFFPGGHGAMYDLPNLPAVAKIVADFADQEKVVASVCHGPASLVNARRADGTPVVQGHRVTGFTNAEETEVHLDQAMPFLLESRLRELGARVETAPNWSDHVVVDGNLVTGQNPQSSISAARAVIGVLSHAP